MRLCTHCISCTNCLPLPKRALFPAEPPPNRPQICERTAVLSRTTRVNGLKESKAKRTSQKHPNSFPSGTKGRRIFRAWGRNHLTSAFQLRVGWTGAALEGKVPDKKASLLLRRKIRLCQSHPLCAFIITGRTEELLEREIKHPAEQIQHEQG